MCVGGGGVEKNVLRTELPWSNEALPDSKSVMATGILMLGYGPREWTEGREAPG